jgi:hypothetical protein
MWQLKRMFFAFVALWIMLEAFVPVARAQEHFLTVTGTVVGIQGGARKWLEVKNEADGTTVNFRIGHNTVYVPHRLPDTGDKVRVMYFIEKGVHVATKVLIFNKDQSP